MQKLSPFFSGLTAAAALLISTSAGATNYTLWIHGKDQSSQPGNYDDWGAWGPSSVSAGVNKKAVNWDGVSHISDQNYRVRHALECFCTGNNFCYVAVHSAGDLQIGYALALFGGSTRNIKNAVSNTSGVCGDAGGTQTGWNIKWVDVASGAGGGSELANLGYWLEGPLTDDLRTGTARSLYNHNTTQARTFYMFAAAKGTVYSGILPGQDDDALGYHSTGGMAGIAKFCNPGDWFCDATLPLGTGGAANISKWANHTVQFRDDAEQYAHGGNDAWEGIISVVRNDVVTYAR
jgi:hypothetical protein